jgi:hypothetical protein
VTLESDGGVTLADPSIIREYPCTLSVRKTLDHKSNVNDIQGGTFGSILKDRSSLVAAIGNKSSIQSCMHICICIRNASGQ